MSAPDAGLGDGIEFRGHVPVSDGHEIYVEVSGNPDGVPAVFLHGGPGSGCQPFHRRLFDAGGHRLVLFDQRGSGLSRPRPGYEANTTQHLVADIEALRTRFGIDRWLLVGGSWGATLALAYAQAHPGAVCGIALRAVFLGTRAEVETAFLDTLPRFHPALSEDFLSLLPQADRARALDAYWERILDPDPAVHRPFALAWHDTERALSELVPGAPRLDPARLRGEGPLPNTPFLEAHYFRHGSFLEDAPLLENAHRLAGIPGGIVQGRYDLLCPPATSHALARAWPDARLVEVPAAGHSLGDGGTSEALRQAIADLSG